MLHKLLMAAALAAVLPLSLSAARDNSLADFPRLAGESDDAPRFQRAVDACKCGVLTVPGDDYTFAQTVYVTNLCSIVMSPSARIKAVAEMARKKLLPTTSTNTGVTLATATLKIA